MKRRAASPLLSLSPSLGPVLAGAVLAGGKSTRMGRNKALLRIDGVPLWRRQLRVMHEAGANPVFLVQAPGQRALTRGVIRDSARDAGPLAGLHAALQALIQCSPARERRDRTSNRGFKHEQTSSLPQPCSHLAVVAVDMPHIDDAWFRRLTKLCRPGVGVIARTRDGYEPLAAIYPVEALALAAAHLATGQLSLQLLAAALVRRKRLRVHRLYAAEYATLTNWNTPDDIKS